MSEKALKAKIRQVQQLVEPGPILVQLQKELQRVQIENERKKESSFVQPDGK